MASKNKFKKLSNTPSYVIILIILLLLVVAYPFIKNTLIRIRFENLVRNEQKSQADLGTLEGRGINPTKYTFKSLPIYSAWTDSGKGFTTTRAVLAPDIADMGLARDSMEIGTKNQFLIVEGDVRDQRTSSDDYRLDMTKYFRFRNEGKDNAPILTNLTYIRPQTNENIHIVFLVDKSLDTFQILSGNLSSPKVTTLNFNSSDVETEDGVYMLNEGVISEYPEE